MLELKDRLERLIGLLTDARDSVVVEGRRCPACNFQVFEDWQRRQVRDHLSGALTRVQKALELSRRAAGC